MEEMTQEEMRGRVFAAWKWCLQEARTTNSARVLAQLICNRYNHQLYPEVDLPGIVGTLDRDRREMAYAIIFYREEPHTVIKDGYKGIEALRKLYRIKYRSPR